MEQYVVFKSHDQLFGLPVTIVRRVVETNKFIPLPEVADYVLGVYEYEEQMLPIIDLGQRFYGTDARGQGHLVQLERTIAWNLR